MPFDALDPQKILDTARLLEGRVAGRFPDRGLRQVAAALVARTETTIAETRALQPPIWGLRLLVGAVVLAGAAVFALVGSVIPLNQIGQRSISSFEGIEAGLNITVLAGLALLALMQLEARVKRRRVAAGLHRLRAMVHVIDMHQLTKDPVALQPGYTARAESPQRDLTAVELERYLDYCSEMLSLIGKLAALYAQAVPDEGVASAVNDIETLGSQLSRKVWQKITLIDSHAAQKAPVTPRKRSPRTASAD
jgi:hypothetical protein